MPPLGGSTHQPHFSQLRTAVTMTTQPGFHNRRPHIASKIRSLLISLTKEPSEYDRITPKIEFWIEYVLRERFTTVDELVEDVSYVAWDQGGSCVSGIGRFLREFYDAPHRSEQARSFVDKLCEYVLRWFAIAGAEDSYKCNDASITSGGGHGFIRAALFVGYLIEWDLLSRELVRQHLIKPLIAHNEYDYCRPNAIYQLFLAAGNALLRGLLEPEDVQVCLEKLNTQMSLGRIVGLDPGKLQVRHTAVLQPHHNLTCLVRNFARPIPRGWSRGREAKGMPREREWVGGKSRRMHWSPKSQQRSKHPPLLFPEISLTRGPILASPPPSCRTTYGFLLRPS